MKSALIIFVRNLVLGRVKTRIAATLGEAEALLAYQYLIRHTQQISKSLTAEKFIFYSDAVETQGWPETYHHCRQSGVDLGARMAHAFEEVFRKGFEKVVIIGSDCLELTTILLEQAFAELDETDVILGPATDGGYYLLGLKKQAPVLFRDINWSTPSVLFQTLNACHQHALAVRRLPVLTDVDEGEEWLRVKENLYG